MLKSLIINNIVLIDKARIDFKMGLCVLTGETGSGKSILLDALGLAIGSRSNSRLIGAFDEKSNIVAEFSISRNSKCFELLEQNQLLDHENPENLIIRRQILNNSTGKVFVNDLPIGVNLLSKIGETLVEIHGQHEQRGLMSSDFHLQLLDEFCKNFELISELKKGYEKLRLIDDEINEFKSKQDLLKRESDYLTYAISELEKAKILENEEENLSSKREILTGKEKILSFLNELKKHFETAGSELLLGQKINIRGQNLVSSYLSQYAEDLSELNDKIDIQISALDSVLLKLDEIINSVNQNQISREEIDERLFLIRSLARKYNTNSNDLPRHLEDLRAQYGEIGKQEQISKELLESRKLELEKYKQIANRLSKIRKENSLVLAKKVEEELSFLKMSNCKFKVEISPVSKISKSQEFNYSSSYSDNQNFTSESSSLGDQIYDEKIKEYYPKGYEKVRFLAAINGDEFEEITKIASGGELSRFMLALKVALRSSSSDTTIIFDEIDTGIGGATSEAVGKRLRILSKNSQILVVTHQPQIASKADLNLKVNKIKTPSNQIKSTISSLEGEEILHEIARMISGDVISNEALAAAKSLLATD